ncbi:MULTISPECIES: hypothetical protein [Bacillus cereus group]|uniref:Uncharacterized protein n=1 Tax=Bacillus cereus BAG5X1-1 TaxID=1053189 RepID=J8BD89_BACCE|nr:MULTISPECIES: hypothetical protein [Bacillus cereus group]EJQ49665.1 hypothetical protein IEE_00789 [Bacillus cereus BAG5X1-1]WIG36145.1 hypothetical protein QPL83_24910 [Bacillus toyonensis]SLK13127.1 hypothetical protein SAMN05880553_3925 [Bacillus toyonensis]
MIPANVQVNIDEKAIKEYILKQIDQQIHETLLLVDIEKLVAITSMSRRFLEDEILSDTRMRVIERRRNRKRWWFYKQALEVIEEIVNEW